MPDPSSPRRLLASEVLAEVFIVRTGSKAKPDLLALSYQDDVAALLACIPDAPHGVTIRPDGTVEAAFEPPKLDPLSDEAKAIKYAAEKAMEPILRQWFTIADERGWAWPEHDAENAAVDLSWELEKHGLLTSARPLPAAPEGGEQ